MQKISTEQVVSPLALGKLLVATLSQLQKEYQWNFRHMLQKEQCGTTGCAIGVAVLLNIVSKEEIDSGTVFPTLAERIGISFLDARYLFDTAPEQMGFTYGTHDSRDVTATMVGRKLAEVIDRIEKGEKQPWNN